MIDIMMLGLYLAIAAGSYLLFSKLIKSEFDVDKLPIVTHALVIFSALAIPSTLVSIILAIIKIIMLL